MVQRRTRRCWRITNKLSSFSFYTFSMPSTVCHSLSGVFFFRSCETGFETLEPEDFFGHICPRKNQKSSVSNGFSHFLTGSSPVSRSFHAIRRNTRKTARSLANTEVPSGHFSLLNQVSLYYFTYC